MQDLKYLKKSGPVGCKVTCRKTYGTLVGWGSHGKKHIITASAQILLQIKNSLLLISNLKSQILKSSWKWRDVKKLSPPHLPLVQLLSPLLPFLPLIPLQLFRRQNIELLPICGDIRKNLDLYKTQVLPGSHNT